MIIADAGAVIDSPLITTVIGVLMTAVIGAAASVIGLFIKVASMSGLIKSIAQDVHDIAGDKDIMRWSQWGPAHENRTTGKETERRHS